MYSIRIDLQRLLRAGGKLPLIIFSISVLALSWGLFGQVPNKNETPGDASFDEAAMAPHANAAVPIGGIVPGQWNCESGEWVPYKDRNAAMDALARGLIDYVLVCESDESVSLFAGREAVEEIFNGGVAHVGESSQTLRISKWYQGESGPDGKTLMAALWAALAMLMVIPVRIAAFLVFQERASGRLEWVLANQMTVRQYARRKSAASTLGAVGLLVLLWGCLLSLGIGFVKFALLNTAVGAIAYEQAQNFLNEVTSRGVLALLSAGTNLAAVAFAVSVIAIRLFLGSRFQLRVTTLTEMSVLLLAFIPLGLPAAPQWIPLFGALNSLQLSVAGEAVSWASVLASVGVSLMIGMAALAGLRPSRTIGR